MKNSKIDPARIKNFPLDNPKAKIVCQRGVYYVCERHYYWDLTKNLNSPQRIRRSKNYLEHIDFEEFF